MICLGMNDIVVDRRVSCIRTDFLLRHHFIIIRTGPKAENTKIAVRREHNFFNVFIIYIFYSLQTYS